MIICLVLGRQRLSSVSEEGQLPLVVCARWGGIGRVATGVTRTRGLPSPPATQALYVMSGHGNLIQYYIHPKHVSGIINVFIQIICFELKFIN